MPPLHMSQTTLEKGQTEKSAVAEHVWSNSHSIAWNHVKILDQDYITQKVDRGSNYGNQKWTSLGLRLG